GRDGSVWRSFAENSPGLPGDPGQCARRPRCRTWSDALPGSTPVEHVGTGAAAGAAHQTSERPEVHTLDDSSEREWVNFVVDAGSEHVVAVDGADVAAAERRGDEVETGNDSLTPG